jgi:DNA integrity scanning protein DisA with diadenylate cyclase activity
MQVTCTKKYTTIRPKEMIMQWLLSNLYIFSWRDVLEILLFSGGIYLITRWLSQDTQKKLAFYFFVGCTTVFAAELFNLPTITSFLMLYWPGLLLLVVVVHQRVLQKNLIFLKNVPAQQTYCIDWIETIIRASFVAASKNKEVVVIIEHNDSLKEHISCPTELTTTLQEPLLSILLESTAFSSGNGILVNTQGTLLGINIIWPAQHQKDPGVGAVKALSDWQDHCITLSSHADCIILRLSLERRTFDVIAQGALVQDSPADTTIHIIKQWIKQNHTHIKKGVHYHEKNNQTNQPSQHSA